MCHHDDDDDDDYDDDHKNTPPHSWALNFNLCHILDPLMSNFAEISICPPPNYSKTMMPCSKIKSLPPKGVYYSLFQSIDAATLTTDWEAKPDQSVVIYKNIPERIGKFWYILLSMIPIEHPILGK